ncbi:hypothetical protein R2A130_2417 [Ahrensia sp. R2A130]|nr:hypothetical protein R2A130_2417 [Ahrensia sp. R2A130]
MIFENSRTRVAQNSSAIFSVAEVFPTIIRAPTFQQDQTRVAEIGTAD